MGLYIDKDYDIAEALDESPYEFVRILAIILEDLVGSEIEPCSFDHRGCCQVHLGGDAPMGCATARGRKFLGIPDGEGRP